MKENIFMDLLLRTHGENESINFDEVWAEGLFVFDANVLLDIYRLPESARNDMIKVLSHKNFKGRIWIAQQVLIEFLYNRLEVISDQKVKYSAVRKLLDVCRDDYFEVFNKLQGELAKLKVKRRHSSIDPDEFITEENISGGISFIDRFVDKLNELEVKQSDVHTDDKIKPIILDLFKGKVGAGFDEETLVEIYKEGEKRYKNSIPPGFKDNGKDGAYVVGDREYIRKYGDLLLWKEIIEKAKSEDLKHVVLVTGDLKEDWWLKKSGKVLGPRKELLNEIYFNAPALKTFYLYETSNFLVRAGEVLKINVKESTINEARYLSRLERASVQSIMPGEYGYFQLKPIIQMCGETGLLGRLRIHSSVADLPALKIDAHALISAIELIVENANRHGDGSGLSVISKIARSSVILTFRNKQNKANVSSDPERHFDVMGHKIHEGASGLLKIYNLLRSSGMRVRAVSSVRNFLLRVYIPKEFFVVAPVEQEDFLME
ncbi:PIN-like domain-containing protein [Pseudomonas fragariae (ex Marin et al. 2024)]|uniref:PIN-like domain-containing protein n=1 Tax=Pseudomonas TaxID=286 RepID=UPI0011AFB3B5|nr:PIN-like domain-containing protein [Pseudomonas syringae]UQB18702.1 DUF4935 domain-containing protein [Pseudomonas syringae pv. syringae]